MLMIKMLWVGKTSFVGIPYVRDKAKPFMLNILTKQVHSDKLFIITILTPTAGTRREKEIN